VRELPDREVHLRRDRLVEAHLHRVADDADDGHRQLAPGDINGDALADRIFVGPGAPRHRLVDDDTPVRSCCPAQ
jgi:hypothetical protein